MFNLFSNTLYTLLANILPTRSLRNKICHLFLHYHTLFTFLSVPRAMKNKNYDESVKI